MVEELEELESEESESLESEDESELDDEWSDMSVLVDELDSSLSLEDDELLSEDSDSLSEPLDESEESSSELELVIHNFVVLINEFTFTNIGRLQILLLRGDRVILHNTHVSGPQVIETTCTMGTTMNNGGPRPSVIVRDKLRGIKTSRH
ncbi:hypothetical protein D9758_018342 [Tetrapyrgos nigripes]|uniref:Uncharacterized protein n=1 Tax=Tetrapyrgos nigripes TaxID=182062 RepID=A0A8H5BV62_9AGAR|nr:hypothetical protein D9758_018342 [Tetrapyrgos nigripes]